MIGLTTQLANGVCAADHDLLGWSDDECVRQYAGTLSFYINHTLRNWDLASEKARREVTHLAGAIDRLMEPLIDEDLLWRGIVDELPRAGDQLRNAGYSSTSIDSRPAHSFAGSLTDEDRKRWNTTEHALVMQLHVPAGMPALVVGEYTACPTSLDESEILLGRGLVIEVLELQPHDDHTLIVAQVLTPASNMPLKLGATHADTSPVYPLEQHV